MRKCIPSLCPDSEVPAWALLICLGAAILLESQLRAQDKPISPLRQAVLEQNGFFYGEEQYYVVETPFVHVYYQDSKESDNESGKVEPMLGHEEARPHRKNGEYHHEVFSLAEGKWIKRNRGFSKEPALYLNGSACDTANKLNVPSGAMAEALPHAIKVKAVDNHEDYAVVVYSDTPDRDEFYSLKTALLIRDSNHWRLVDTIFSGDAVHFCGVEAFRTRFRNGEEPRILLVYLGDADPKKRYFVSIQSFLVRDARSRLLKQKN